MAERRRDHKQQKQQEAVANGASQQAVKAEGDADLLKDSEQPLPFADRTGNCEVLSSLAFRNLPSLAKPLMAEHS